MSEADPAAVKQYLVHRQMQPETIDWKYFDSPFNRGRERGVVWLRENQVLGFLGLIPFALKTGEIHAQCAWSCDWSVDASQAAGMGLLLVKRARELYDGMFNLGGNENTRRIFPRLADLTLPDAGVAFVLPLRLGSLFARLSEGGIKRFLQRRQGLRRIPLRLLGSPRESPVTFEPGLSPRLLSLVDHYSPDVWRPSYNSEFFAWQFQRCPDIRCWSCWIGSDSPLRTAAVVWRSSHSQDFWRLGFFGHLDDSERLETLIASIIQFVYSHRCIALFAITSRRENDLAGLFRRRGFFRYRNLPLYLMRGRNTALPLDEFGALSFFDADLAHRFEQDEASSNP